MATLLELRSIFSNDADLKSKIEASLLIAMKGVLDGAPVNDDFKYADHLFANIGSEAGKAFLYVLAANNNADVSQIQGASDSLINTNVAQALTILSAAYNVA